MKLVLIAVNLDVLNVTLLIPVPKSAKKTEMKGIMWLFAYILYSVLMLVHCY